MAHDKVFGICENKCLVEVSPKTDVVKAQSTADGKVSKDGNVAETITGVKSFTAGLQMNEGGNATLTGGIWSTGHAYADLNAINANGVCATVRVRSNADGTAYATAPSPAPSATDSSTKIVTTEWVNNKDNDVVHKSRGEIITGEKTVDGCSFIIKGNYPAVAFKDTSGTEQGYVQYRASDSRVRLASANGYIELYAPKGYATAPATPNDATSNEIATAGWVRDRIAQAGTSSGRTITSYTDPSALFTAVDNMAVGDEVMFNTMSAVSDSGDNVMLYQAVFKKITGDTLGGSCRIKITSGDTKTYGVVNRMGWGASMCDPYYGTVKDGAWIDTSYKAIQPNNVGNVSDAVVINYT